MPKPSRLFSLALLTMGSRVTGFIRTVLFAWLFGTSRMSDIFFVAFKFPNLFRRLFAEGAMSSAFVPLLIDLKEKDPQEAKEFFARIWWTMLSLLLLIQALVFFLAPGVVHYFFQDNPLSGDERAHAVVLLRIMFPYLLFLSLAAIIQGVLNSHKNFKIPAITPILFNFCIILTASFLVFFGLEDPQLQTRYLSLAVMVGGLVQLLVQLPWLLGLNYKLLLPLPLVDKRVLTYFRLLLPVVFSAGIYQITQILIDPLTASLGDGKLTALTYSLRLQELPLGVIAVSISTIMLPGLSRYNAKNRNRAALFLLKRGLFTSYIYSLPVVLGGMFFARDVLCVLFFGGAFNERSLEMTSLALMWHMPAVIFVSANRLIFPMYYSRKKNKMIFFFSLLSAVVTLAVAFAYKYLGGTEPWGMAMAGGLGALLLSLVSFTFLLRFYSLKTLIFVFGRVGAVITYTCAMILCYIALFLFFRTINWPSGDGISLRLFSLLKLVLVSLPVLGLHLLLFRYLKLRKWTLALFSGKNSRKKG